MSVFIPKETHVLVGEVWSDPKNRSDKHEEDHSLYFDTSTLSFFVVAYISNVSGPNASSHDTEYGMAAYLRQHPDRKERLLELLPKQLRSKPRN